MTVSAEHQKLQEQLELEEGRLINTTLNSMLKGDKMELFITYLKLYKKNYEATSPEGQKRFTIFCSRLEEINSHNDDKTKTWTLGLDQFSDMTLEEFKRNYTMKNTKFKDELFYTAGLNIIEYKPDTSNMNYRPIDWSKYSGKSIVQGDCGSCFAISTVNALETNYALATGKQFEYYSKQQILDCNIYSHGCDGGDKKVVIGYQNIYGLVPEASYPYTQKVGPCQYDVLKGSAKKLSNGFESVNDIESTAFCGKAGLFDTLTRGVVVSSIDAAPLQGFKTGILDLKGRCTESNHAILITGYGIEAGVEYWIVKNTWGPTSGVDGYVRVKVYDDKNDFQNNCYLQCKYVRPFFEIIS